MDHTLPWLFEADHSRVGLLGQRHSMLHEPFPLRLEGGSERCTCMAFPVYTPECGVTLVSPSRSNDSRRVDHRRHRTLTSRASAESASAGMGLTLSCGYRVRRGDDGATELGSSVLGASRTVTASGIA